jgi:hypothetical protein
MLRAMSVTFLEPGDDPPDRGREVVHADRLGAPPRGQKRRLVHQVGEVGAGKARRQRGDFLGIDVLRQQDLIHMHLQDGDPAALVGPVHQHLPVEAAGAQRRRIEDLGPVDRPEQHQPRLLGVEPVELDEQLG